MTNTATKSPSDKPDSVQIFPTRLDLGKMERTKTKLAEQISKLPVGAVTPAKDPQIERMTAIIKSLEGECAKKRPLVNPSETRPRSRAKKKVVRKVVAPVPRRAVDKPVVEKAKPIQKRSATVSAASQKSLSKVGPAPKPPVLEKKQSGANLPKPTVLGPGGAPNVTTDSATSEKQSSTPSPQHVKPPEFKDKLTFPSLKELHERKPNPTPMKRLSIKSLVDLSQNRIRAPPQTSKPPELLLKGGPEVKSSERGSATSSLFPNMKDQKDSDDGGLACILVNKKQELLEREYQTVAHLVTRKRYLQLKVIAEDSIREEKTFAICGRSNGYHMVRKYFSSRNWIERYANPEEKKPVYGNLTTAPDNDSYVLSRLTSRVCPKFIWTECLINWAMVGNNTLVNKFPSGARPLSTKVGLLNHLNRQVWTYNANYAYVKHPRSISIYDEDDMSFFSSVYRMNACVCLLKLLVESYDANKPLVTADGTVTIDCVDFAVQRVCEQVTFMENSDLDKWNISVVSEDEWTLFLLRFHDVANFGAKFINTNHFDLAKLVRCARKCLQHVKQFWPDIDVEGIRNLWMIKPSASSCGRGIKTFKTLVDIVSHCKPGFHYLAQRYIERPMIIHKTKFDIRQWFLVTSIHPLMVYMYDICYLRFCSREFSLSNLHEAIHLSNNSVQCRYTNMNGRSPDLPSDNMWDSNTFLNYLRGRNEDDKWFAITLPGIRKGIVGALLASQPDMVHRPNSFNLYGADFMLTDDFVPWLIEINNGPCLRSTTSVTSRLCPMVIEDTLNLILKTRHPLISTQQPSIPGSVDTGRFRLIYSQKVYPNGVYPLRGDICVVAKKAKIHPDRSYEQVKKPSVAVPIFPDSDEDMICPQTYESRSLKYEEIADYKHHNSVNLKPAVASNEDRFPPILPGGIPLPEMFNHKTPNWTANVSAKQTAANTEEAKAQAKQLPPPVASVDVKQSTTKLEVETATMVKTGPPTKLVAYTRRSVSQNPNQNRSAKSRARKAKRKKE